MKIAALSCVTLLLFSCTSIFRPYKCGPVLKEDQIQIFKRVNEFIELKAGDTFADVGSSSGYYPASMAVFVDSVDFYLQDIDENCLNSRNVKRVLKYYSRFTKRNMDEINRFHIVLGMEKKTNLPLNTFNKIYSNATYHVLDYPDDIMSDLHTKLKPGGYLFIRDEFVYNDEVKYCGSKDCRRQLPKYEMFIKTMERNGFELAGQSSDIGSYPIYKFRKR